jgi:hypothetical protein
MPCPATIYHVCLFIATKIGFSGRIAVASFGQQRLFLGKRCNLPFLPGKRRFFSFSGVEPAFLSRIETGIRLAETKLTGVFFVRFFVP